MSMETIASRRKATANFRARIENLVALELTPSLFASTDQFDASLRDAQLVEAAGTYTGARTALAGTPLAEGERIASSLRPLAQALTEATEAFSARLELLALVLMSDPDWLTTVRDTHHSICVDALLVLDSAVEGSSGLDRTPRAIPHPSSYRGVAEPVAATFGVDLQGITDVNGRVLPSRLVATYRLRFDELEEICNRLTLLVGAAKPNVFDVIGPILDLVRANSPLLVLEIARATHAELTSAHESDPVRARKAAATYLDENEKLWASFVRFQDRIAVASATDSKREKSTALLEAYRYFVEGITRRWIACLLEARGIDSGSLTVHQLVEPAQAHLGKLGDLFSASLIAGARNAEAHDDFFFDETRESLIVDGVPVSAEEIERAISNLDLIQRGWMIGHVCAFTDQPDLPRGERNASLPITTSFRTQRAIDRFGHAGLAVRDISRAGDQLTVDIDHLEPKACNPCFVALIQSALILPEVELFRVRVGEQLTTAIELSGASLRNHAPLLEVASACFPSGIPTGTFVPLMAQNRRRSESIEQVSRACVWLLANELQHALCAYFDKEVSGAEFLNWLRITGAATDLTQSELEFDARGFDRVRRETENLVASAGPKKMSRANISIAIDRVADLREDFAPAPAVLPSLSDEPIALSDNPRGVS